MTSCISKKTISLLLVIVTIVSFLTTSVSAKTIYEPIVTSYLNPNSPPKANTETYKIKLGWFCTSKTVSFETSKRFTSTSAGVTKEDCQKATQMARFDVTVQYNGKNACYTRVYRNLKLGDSFKLDGKAWNESKTYTITVKSYFVNYSTRYWQSCFCTYAMKY